MHPDNIFGLDNIQGSLDQMLQFPGISRPLIAAKYINDIFGDTDDIFAKNNIVLVYKMAGKVLNALFETLGAEKAAVNVKS